MGRLEPKGSSPIGQMSCGKMRRWKCAAVCQKLSMMMLPTASAMPVICTGVSFSWKRKQE